MNVPPFHYRWEWRFRSPPERLWPLVADTNHFNRDTHVPPVRGGPGGVGASGRRQLQLVRLGFQLEWEEEPFEWVRPQRFGVVRRYTRAPILEMRVRAELHPRTAGGTTLLYEVWAQPRNLLGALAIVGQVGIVGKRRFRATFRRYDRMAAAGQSFLHASTRVELATGGQERLEQLRRRLAEDGADQDLLDRLVEILLRGDDLVVARLRPYALADDWGVSRRSALELCLQATRAGLLDFRWEVLCPLCRGSEERFATLEDVRAEIHCTSCNIDYTANFDRLVELVFRPNPSVRRVDVAEYCVGGPQVTPHIVAQQLLAPHQTRTIVLPLEEGRYRVRTLALPGSQSLVVARDGSPKAAISAGSDGWREDELQLAHTATVKLQNLTATEQLFILERMAWSDQATTAAEVIALQLFRDLFAREVLRPKQQLSVGSLTILFTDLRGSTRLYRQIGDAPAFGRVLDHFDVLREAIAAEGGALIKTIGDAVMAAFPRPATALRAALRAQQQLATPEEGAPKLMLKAGIHTGPCLAVTLNDRLDYFGSTVNVAARLEGQSSGEDVVISAAVRYDPEVADLLDQQDGPAVREVFAGALKGFDEELFDLYRVTSKEPVNQDAVEAGASPRR